MSRKSQTTRRSVLTATGALSLLGLAGVGSAGTASDDAVPVPDDADERTYPTIGTNADAPTATVYGNFKCPYTQDFVSGNLQEIVEEFVVTGRLNVRFCNLAYEPGDTSQHYISDSDPRLAAVGLAIWNEDSSSYWQFVSETYANSPSGYVDYDELEDRARSADVTNAESCVDRAEAGEYDAAVERIAEIADDDGVSFTPQFELAGETTAPHHGTQAILNWIESRLEDAPDGETSDDEDGAEEESDETETDDEVEEPKEESDVEEADGEDADADETDDDSEGTDSEDAEDTSDSEDSDSEDTEETDSEDTEETSDDDTEDDTDDSSDGSSDSSGGIGAGEDYDLSDDRTVDDLPVDC
ncbi:thioredoxin domain-containing protein [Natronococcus sp. JC468]|uniref:DsbA family protein n=1 Tax=Natronococcus sp. JC468 TaxID=1961921 RepID=UPI00143C68BA|nr:thioredoxin domain-containing protein [Natronococcus sp. JC468]NKE35977.1 thioredoxin domain-containing protein [Natronococcus sp. JC468]